MSKIRISNLDHSFLSKGGSQLALVITAVGLRSVGFGTTHFSLDKSRMGGDTFQPKNPTFLKPTVIGSPFFNFSIVIYQSTEIPERCSRNTYW